MIARDINHRHVDCERALLLTAVLIQMSEGDARILFHGSPWACIQGKRMAGLLGQAVNKESEVHRLKHVENSHV